MCLCGGSRSRCLETVGVVAEDFRKRGGVSIRDAGKVYAGTAVAVVGGAGKSGYTCVHVDVVVEV